MSIRIKSLGFVGSALLAVGATMAMQASPTLAAQPAVYARPTIINAGPARVMPDSQVPCGVQFTFTLNPNQTAQFFTFGWDPANFIQWTVDVSPGN